MTCVRVLIAGRVQGVWYRAWTNEEARELGLNGWVRNRADGSVEAVFSGDETAVDVMLALCRSGPPLAKVDSVTVEPWTDPVASGFEQRQTV